MVPWMATLVAQLQQYLARVSTRMLLPPVLKRVVIPSDCNEENHNANCVTAAMNTLANHTYGALWSVVA